MQPTPQEAFALYENLKIQERHIAAQLDELKEIIFPLVPEDAEVEGEHGVFYLQKRAKWTYSKDTKRAEEDLKKSKKTEEADGTATATYSSSLYYRTKKTEESDDE